ncbi:DUF4307 domain-containing protein [Agromyces intestinalis]|uniref:DUF4307 domain-containing protein n=1 Tax=Agromyces intestinalis TaxID=2592652 RepID=A0A5C1YJX5_9MICO|nr:DUF4307 domain-containing protein [Agromyces intestinalis]QEO15469.1 DUF4307 domain-containing protein [Agromyces intestinalis]
MNRAEAPRPDASDPEASAPATAALDARYGRTRPNRTRDRLIIVGAAVFAAIVIVAWVVWAGLDGSKPQVQATDLAHALLPDERAVEVTWKLSVPPGNDTACAIQALNEDYTVVGWKIVEIPASDSPIRNFTERVRTAMEANTGLVAQCWVV